MSDLDSIQVADEVSEEMGGQVNLVNGKLLLHEIVLATIRVLANHNFLVVEFPETKLDVVSPKNWEGVDCVTPPSDNSHGQPK